MKGYLMPHPPLLVPGVGRGGEAPDTEQACRRVATEIEKIKPDTVVVISPHSVMYADFFHIAPGKAAAGDFGSFGAKQIKISVNYDEEFARLIGKLAQEKGLPAGPLGEKKTVLDHGVMVPLHFLKSERIVRISLSGLSAIDQLPFGNMHSGGRRTAGAEFRHYRQRGYVA